MTNNSTQTTRVFTDGDDDGYEVPFATFPWVTWQEMQAQTFQRFTRFQRAITRQQLQEAAEIVLEMREMIMLWQKEVCGWLGEGGI